MEYNKKPKTNSKIGKYYKARKEGKTQMESQQQAGFGNGKAGTRIEASKTYQELEKKFKDCLLEQITMEDITKALVENIQQSKDKGAKNTAIKLAKDSIEPQGNMVLDEGEVNITISKG